MARDEVITGLDVGSSKIRTVIGQIDEEGKPHIIGVGEAPSEGIRRGVVVDVEEAVSSISASLEKAERTSGIPVEHAYVNVGGNHLMSQSSKGVIAVSRADSEIGEDDVERVIEAASAVSIPANYEILHVIPRDFIVDSQEGIKDPVGMSGIRLEVETSIIEGAASYVKNLTKCVHRTGIDIDELVASPLAAASSVLNKRQKELGVVILDIGGGTTSLVVFEEGEMLDLAVLPVGGSHITNDLAIGLRTSIDVAEKVKLEYGSARSKDIDKKESIDLSKISDAEEETVSRRRVADIVEARLSEIMSLADKELKKIDRSEKLPAGVVLSGGGSKMPGIVDLAKREMRLPAQVGFPMELHSPVDKVDDPSFATAVGLVLWGIGHEDLAGKRPSKISSVTDSVGNIKKWFKNFLP